MHRGGPSQRQPRGLSYAAKNSGQLRSLTGPCTITSHHNLAEPRNQARPAHSRESADQQHAMGREPHPYGFQPTAKTGISSQ